ncbi:class I SAM-dependent methyltransferase [Actinoplanes sp. NPDC026623]|uniref:class I SAM-dependent methyltransferase n=1 Tax=Actinoplanes sp. NPDC026623 TaxID=3155610 RepID=UPI0033DCF13D
MSDAALSFGSEARLYDSIRPTYPVGAIAAALGTEALRVLDLGAGTGLLTGALVAAGHDVVGVEPDEQMRAVAAERWPATRFLAGSAEDIPLPDGCVDAVVVGQAYHWFTPENALPEIHRVLRDGGVFAPMWNVRDERVPWVAALSGIAGSEGSDLDNPWPSGPVAPWFTEPTLSVVEHAVTIRTGRLIDLVRSRSYYLTADDAERARVDREIGELATTDPALAGRDSVEMPYRACVYRMRRV